MEGPDTDRSDQDSFLDSVIRIQTTSSYPDHVPTSPLKRLRDAAATAAKEAAHSMREHAASLPGPHM